MLYGINGCYLFIVVFNTQTIVVLKVCLVVVVRHIVLQCILYTLYNTYIYYNMYTPPR